MKDYDFLLGILMSCYPDQQMVGFKNIHVVSIFLHEQTNESEIKLKSAQTRLMLRTYLKERVRQKEFECNGSKGMRTIGQSWCCTAT
eukprot:764295-Hanusia_phi.AAC.2